jgi:ATP-dependent helicase HrpB
LVDSLDKQQQESESNDGQKRSVLPIFDVLESVRESLASKPNLLLQAAPGAGKTTIVPLQLLLDALLLEEDGGSSDVHNKQILVVAPRRVAVRSAAQRMTALIGEGAPGGTIGYAMRDEARVSSSTLVKVITDGVLLNLLREDPELKGVGHVVLDEFHERGVGSDTSLALLREVQQNFREEDLKIVVMSATLLGNTDRDCGESSDGDVDSSTGSKLMRTLGGSSNCGIVESEGRQYPIQLKWANDVVQDMSKYNSGGGGRNGIPPLGSLLRDRKSLIQTAANVVERAALKQAPDRGDVLVFLPGAAECRGVVRELNSRSAVANVADVFPLYGAMPKEDQDKVLYPSKQQGTVNSDNRRQRVIVSTPIAEASLTIPSVTCVVDSGLRREPRCDADTGMSRLVSTRISRASAIQRSGRAGRVQEGSCLRLYTETDFERDFVEQSPPEIASTDLAPILLLLADWGASTLSEILQDMPFVDPPEEKSLERAEQFLVEIGALEKTDNQRFRLTELGRTISKMPCHPRLAASISKAMNIDGEDSFILAASIAAAFCLDDDSSVQRSGNNDDPNLAYTIPSLVQIPSKFSALLRFAGRVGGTRGRAAVQALQTNENDFMRTAIANLGKAMLPGFVDLVGERKGDASYDSSNYFLAVSGAFIYQRLYTWIILYLKRPGLFEIVTKFFFFSIVSNLSPWHFSGFRIPRSAGEILPTGVSKIPAIHSRFRNEHRP